MAVSSWSDARAKKVLGRSSGAHDLDTLNRIQITDYQWIDQNEDHGRHHKKVIAQQVEEIFPEAVARTEKAIPSVYEKATQVVYDATRHVLSFTLGKEHEFQPGDQVDIFTDRGDLKKAWVIETPTARTFTVAGTNEASGAFVSGKWVKDYRMVDYDALAMLNISATQELYRQLKAKDQEIAALKQHDAELKKQSDELKKESSDQREQSADLRQQNAQLEKRLATLEAEAREQSARFAALEQLFRKSLKEVPQTVSAKRTP